MQSFPMITSSATFWCWHVRAHPTAFLVVLEASLQWLADWLLIVLLAAAVPEISMSSNVQLHDVISTCMMLLISSQGFTVLRGKA